MSDFRRLVFGLFALSLVVFLPPRLAASPIEARRSELDDTGFVSWLSDTEFDSGTLRRQKWKLLSASERLPADRRLKYYRRWTKATGTVHRPVDQIRLAGLEAEDELAETWLETWLRGSSVDRSKLDDVIDNLLDAGKFELVERAVERGRKIFNSNQLYFRRLAASYYAREQHRRAIEEYVRVGRNRRLGPRFKHRLSLAVSQDKLEQFFITKIADQATQMKQPGKFISMAVDFVVDSASPGELLSPLLELSGDTEFRAKQLGRIMSQLLEKNRPELAARAHRNLVELTGLDSDKLIDRAEIFLKMQKPDSALAVLSNRGGTEPFELNRRAADKLRVRAYLFGNNYDSAADLLTAYPDRMFAEKVELWKARGDYSRMAEFARAGDTGRAWPRFYSAYMNDDVDTAALNQLVNAEPDRPETSLALALAALEDGELAREFLRWLGQFPLEQEINMVPPEKFYGDSNRLPRVLVERWYENFDVRDKSAAELVALGRNLSFPSLLLDGARRYRNRGKPEKSREILEKLLIDYPETLHRPEVEAILTELGE